MSECVVRMEMPQGCWDCPCVNGEYGYCQADKEERQIEDPVCARKSNGRPSWCPIICQLPEGHGRLGDLDRLAKMVNAARIEAMQKGFDTNPYWLLGDIIAQAKTIVPAERSEK